MPMHQHGGSTEGPFPEQPRVADMPRKEPSDESLADARVRALHFLQTVAANLDNPKMDDEAFRQFMRNSLDQMPGVDYTKPKPPGGTW